MLPFWNGGSTVVSLSHRRRVFAASGGPPCAYSRERRSKIQFFAYSPIGREDVNSGQWSEQTSSRRLGCRSISCRTSTRFASAARQLGRELGRETPDLGSRLPGPPLKYPLYPPRLPRYSVFRLARLSGATANIRHCSSAYNCELALVRCARIGIGFQPKYEHLALALLQPESDLCSWP